MKMILVSIALLASSALQCGAFVTPTQTQTSLQTIQRPQKLPTRMPFIPNTMDNISTPTSLQMGYNLPPGGGGGDKDDKIASLATPILTIAATVLFFLSPLGSIFFAITNSIVLFVILTPILAALGFQVWQTFYTIEAPCPNCGSPARVLKEDEAGPSMCYNCGSLVRANVEKDGIELCNNPNDIYDDNSRISSLFDLFTGGVDSDAGGFMGGGNSGGFMGFDEETPTSTTTKMDDDSKNKKRRESTVIDVETKDD
jgi:hypothetical protein